MISGEPDQGLFMALETLRLGVAGKSCRLALQQVGSDYDTLAAFDLAGLIERPLPKSGGLPCFIHMGASADPDPTLALLAAPQISEILVERLATRPNKQPATALAA